MYTLSIRKRGIGVLMTFQQPRKDPRCLLCNHVAVDQINTLLTDPTQRLSTAELRVWLKNHFPAEPIPTHPAILNHRKKHLGFDPMSPGDMELSALRIDRQTGELVTTTGRKIEAVGIVAALKTVITVGITNILRNPESVSPSNTLEALKMLKMLGIEDEDPNMVAWQDSVLQPGEMPPKRPPKKKTGKEYIDDITEVIEVPVDGVSTDSEESRDSEESSQGIEIDFDPLQEQPA